MAFALFVPNFQFSSLRVPYTEDAFNAFLSFRVVLRFHFFRDHPHSQSKRSSNPHLYSLTSYPALFIALTLSKIVYLKSVYLLIVDPLEFKFYEDKNFVLSPLFSRSIE